MPQQESHTVRLSISPSVFLLAFICFKVFGVVDWSWWWITSPIWVWAAMNFLKGALDWFTE